MTAINPLAAVLAAFATVVTALAGFFKVVMPLSKDHPSYFVLL
jgi:hypothetical protein